MKILTIKLCSDCKYNLKICCDHPNIEKTGGIVFDDYPNIPDWCPLEDYNYGAIAILNSNDISFDPDEIYPKNVE